MHREDDPIRRDEGRSGAARPEQVDEGFGQGFDREPDTPAEREESDFARGQRSGTDLAGEDRGDFAEGVDANPDTPEEEHQGTFAEGLDRDTRSP